MRKLSASEKMQILEEVNNKDSELLIKRVQDFFSGVNNFSEYEIRTGSEGPLDLKAIHICSCGNEKDLELQRYRIESKKDGVRIDKYALGDRLSRISYVCPCCGAKNVFYSKDAIDIYPNLIVPIISYGSLSGNNYIALSNTVSYPRIKLSSLERSLKSKEFKRTPREIFVFFDNGDVLLLNKRGDFITQMAADSKTSIKTNEELCDIITKEKDKVIAHIGELGYNNLRGFEKYGADFAFLLMNDAAEFTKYESFKDAIDKITLKYGDHKKFEKIISTMLINTNVVQLDVPDTSEFVDFGGISFSEKTRWHQYEKIHISYFDTVIVRYFEEQDGKLVESSRKMGTSYHLEQQFFGMCHKSYSENSYLSRFTADQIRKLKLPDKVSMNGYNLFYGPMEQIWSMFEPDWVYKLCSALLSHKASDFFGFSYLPNKNGKNPKDATGYSSKIIRQIFTIMYDIIFNDEQYPSCPEKLMENFLSLPDEAKEIIHNLPEEDVEYIFRNLCNIDHLGYRSISQILNHISVKKIEPYLQDCGDRQRIDRDSAIMLWGDFLNYSELAGLRLDKKTKFPFSLKLSHDQAHYSYNIIKSEARIKKFKERVSSDEYREYEVETDHLIMISPKDPSDLSQEGKNLSHCVGAYVDRIANGANVYFIRKKSAPDKSFATIEISIEKKRIVQCRGFDNKDLRENPYIVELFGQLKNKGIKACNGRFLLLK